MHELTLDRRNLRLGKYTSRYADLTPMQLEGLLWLLGEWSARVRPDGSLGANKNRAKVALDTLRDFHIKPLVREEVRALMREAARGKPSNELEPEPKVCINAGCDRPQDGHGKGTNVCYKCWSEGLYDY